MGETAPGLEFRIKKVDKSQHCDLKGRLRVECLDVDKYILANNDIKLRMFPLQPKMCLWSDHDNYDYRITILRAGTGDEDFSMYVFSL